MIFSMSFFSRREVLVDAEEGLYETPPLSSTKKINFLIFSSKHVDHHHFLSATTSPNF